MSEQPWMPLYVADYLRDTDHLTIEESGAYLHLLMAMWARDGTIPDNDHDNARRLHFRIDKWRRVKERLMPFLARAENGNLTQKRLYNERLAAQSRIRNARANGAKGGRPPAKINVLGKPSGSIPVNPDESSRARVCTTTTTKKEVVASAHAREAISEAEENALRLAAGAALNDASPNLFIMAEPLRWKAAGMDWQLDVLPAITGAVVRAPPGRVRDWKYFSDAIAHYHTARTAPMPTRRHANGPRPARHTMSDLAREFSDFAADQNSSAALRSIPGPRRPK